MGNKTRSGRLYYVNTSGEVVKAECNKCKKIKDISNFSAKKNGFKGKESRCKMCRKEHSLKWVRDNKEKKLQDDRCYYDSNRDKKKKVVSDYRRNHVASYQIYAQRRLARKRGLPDTFNSNGQEYVLSMFGYKCALTGDSWTWDHAIPLASGHGGTTQENMYPLRSDLNTSKSDNNIFDWFYTNKDRFSLSQRKFDELIKYLAVTNDMSIGEYEQYVRNCHVNRRKIDEGKTAS